MPQRQSRLNYIMNNNFKFVTAANIKAYDGIQHIEYFELALSIYTFYCIEYCYIDLSYLFVCISAEVPYTVLCPKNGIE